MGGGAAQATVSTANVAHELRAPAQNLLGGSLTGQFTYGATLPTGAFAQFGVWIGTLRAYFDRSEGALRYQVRRWFFGTDGSGELVLGGDITLAYSDASFGWQRIAVDSTGNGTISFQTSGDGATWTTHATWAIPNPFTARALEPFWYVDAWQTVASTTMSMLSLTATGSSISDRSHADVGPGSLLFAEDFDGTALDPNRWDVDENATALVAAANTSVGSSVLSLKIASGKGARVYWGGWKVRPPHIKQFGRYEVRMKLTRADNTGPAVMIWPENDNYAYGEFDIFEVDGNYAQANIHWSPTLDMVNNHQTWPHVSRWIDWTQWHIWIWEWSPTLQRVWIAQGDGTKPRMIMYHNGGLGVPHVDHDIRIHNRFNDGITPTGTETGSLDIDFIKLYSTPATITR